jgi:hypothetical protein
LRPLSVGEILDAGIKVFTRHWKPLAGLVAAVTAPVYVVYVLLLASIDDELLDFSTSFSTSSQTSDTNTDTTVLVGFGLSYLLLFITILLAFVACFKAVSDAWLGSVPSVSRSLRFAVRHAFKTAVLGLMAALVVGIGFALCLVPGIWIGVAWSLCFPALLFERIGPVHALKRSWSLTKNRWWATFLVVVVGNLLVSIIGGVIQLGLVGIADGVADDSTIALAIAQVIASTASAAVTYPFLAAVLTILYFDQRVRKEGFDLQLQAEGFGIARDPDAPLPAPLIGDDIYTPEQRAAAPYWPPPPGWTPPPPEPVPSEWSSPSGWAAPSSDAPEPPAWSGQSYPTGGQDQRSGDALAPADAPPTDPLPPPEDDDPPPRYPSWSERQAAAQKPGDDEDEGDKRRAGWLPPEPPRGPGGL